MSIARIHTWSANEILLASDLNTEFNNIIGNGSDLVSPFTKAISLGGFALNFDAANTIAATATTSGVVMTGGTIREPVENTVTAFATGGQTNATALSAAVKFHRISVCATAADSYKLPTSTAGQAHYVRNDGAAAAQAFGAGTDTINGVATATGIPHPVGVGIWFVCTASGNWTTGSLVAISGNFPVTLTATASTNVTLPTTGTLATLSGVESLSNKTIVPNFTSSETAIGGASSTTTAAHGLGAVPTSFSVMLRNKTTEFGYAVGDEVGANFLPSGVVLTGWSDATNIGVTQSGSSILVVRRDTFVTGAINTANWKYVFRAWK
jgi:hypothetical protein